MAIPTAKKLLDIAIPQAKPKIKQLIDTGLGFLGSGVRLTPQTIDPLTRQLENVANGNHAIIVGAGADPLSKADAEALVDILKAAGGIIFDGQTGRYVLYDITAEIPTTWDERADTVFGQMVAMYTAQAREKEESGVADRVHGNSKESKRPQHMYEIFRFNRNNPSKQEVVKTGISGITLVPGVNPTSLLTGNVRNSQLISARAEKQVRGFNRLEPEGSNIVYGYRIVEINMPDRATALEREIQNTKDLRSQGHRLVEQKRPSPEIGTLKLPYIKVTN